MHTLITAVPGSGKTTTLAREITTAIESGVPPEMIYAITFTREAARELEERCHPGIHASTIHSLAFRILRGVYTTTDADLLHSGIMYDEMLTQAQEHSETFAAELLVIDEAQDLSLLQFEFICSLLPGARSVIVVGDSMQSIFSFTGGDPKYMLAFTEQIPEMQTVSLQYSYRIPRVISDYINTIFTPAVPIASTTEGGTVATHIVPEHDLFDSIIDAMTDHAGVLVRTNADIITLIQKLGNRMHDVNYSLPLSAHPYVSFASAVISMGLCIDPVVLRRAADLVGGLSRGAVRTLHALRGQSLTRNELLELCSYTSLYDIEGGCDYPLVSQKSRKEFKILIELCELYREFYGKTTPDAILALLTRIEDDGYGVGSVWRETIHDTEVLVEAIRKRVLMGTDSYYTVDNASSTTIMTIHAAKGKEFDTVLLAVNGRTVNIYDAEEFRVLYVGCTRAKHALTVFVPDIRTQDHSRVNILDMFIPHTQLV